MSASDHRCGVESVALSASVLFVITLLCQDDMRVPRGWTNHILSLDACMTLLQLLCNGTQVEVTGV